MSQNGVKMCLSIHTDPTGLVFVG